MLFGKCIYILALKMASPGNHHYDNYIGTLSFPIDSLRNIWNHIYLGILLEITAHSDLFFCATQTRLVIYLFDRFLHLDRSSGLYKARTRQPARVWRTSRFFTTHLNSILFQSTAFIHLHSTVNLKLLFTICCTAHLLRPTRSWRDIARHLVGPITYTYIVQPRAHIK